MTDTQETASVADAVKEHISPEESAKTEDTAVEEDSKTEAAVKEDAADSSDEKEDPKFEAYELEAAEGTDADSTKIFSELSNKYKIPKEEAQKFVEDFTARQVERAQKVMAEWGEQSKADEEFGGAKFEENAALAKQALKKYGGDKLVKALEDTGFGNHPELIRAFYRVGKDMSDDKVMTQVKEASKPKTFASAISDLAEKQKMKGKA